MYFPKSKVYKNKTQSHQSDIKKQFEKKKKRNHALTQCLKTKHNSFTSIKKIKKKRKKKVSASPIAASNNKQ